MNRTAETRPAAFRPVILVPHYNHLRQFETFLPRLQTTNTPLLVVDDGSDPDQRERLERLAAESGFRLLTQETNQGKGAAVISGLYEARRLGYSHALQVDADGQHETGDIPRFLDCAKARPGTIICGAPVFGEDAPWERIWGRKLTNLMVILETWTLAIRDSLFGFRVYPLAETLQLVGRRGLGRRMDFDTKILVEARWAGLPLHFLDTRVAYPEDGASHFRYGVDNARMVGLHARLLARMLLQSPWQLWALATGRLGKVTGDRS